MSGRETTERSGSKPTLARRHQRSPTERPAQGNTLPRLDQGDWKPAKDRRSSAATRCSPRRCWPPGRPVTARERAARRIEKACSQTAAEHIFPKLVEHHVAMLRIKDNPPLNFHQTELNIDPDPRDR
jgi:hypothetical protein